MEEACRPMVGRDTFVIEFQSIKLTDRDGAIFAAAAATTTLRSLGSRALCGGATVLLEVRDLCLELLDAFLEAVGVDEGRRPGGGESGEFHDECHSRRDRLTVCIHMSPCGSHIDRRQARPRHILPTARSGLPNTGDDVTALVGRVAIVE